jgi:plasmid maintenance system antidote protein VapI
MLNNKITQAIERQRVTIETNVQAKGITPEKLKQISSSMDMDIEEFCKFQELKSLAMMQNKLTLDEAQTVYAYLGEVPEHFNNQPLAVKVILTKLFSELLSLKISGRV